MNGRGRTITVVDRGTTIVLKGFKVAEIARHAGLRPVYNGVAQGWVSDSRKLGDLLAFCQSRHIAIEVTGPTPAVGDVHLADDGDVHLGPDRDVDLFGGAA